MEYYNVSIMATSIKNVMDYFSNFANYCMDNKRKVFIFIVLFHALTSVLLNYIVNTDYLLSLHDDKIGFWDFSSDSYLYHTEAIILAEGLDNSLWLNWFASYPDHQHVKIISLLYWITGYYSPLMYEVLINPFVWASSVFLMYKSSQTLFPGSNKIPLITSLFFFQPSVFMHSTQLLRDPIFTLGFCLLTYGIISVFKHKLKWKSVLIINAGIFIMIAMKAYLTPILLSFIIIFCLTIYVKKLSPFLPILFILFPLITFQYLSVNKYFSLDKIIITPTSSQFLMPSIERDEQIALEADRAAKNRADEIAVLEVFKAELAAKNRADEIAALEVFKAERAAKKIESSLSETLKLQNSVNQENILNGEFKKSTENTKIQFFTDIRDSSESPVYLVKTVIILDNIAKHLSILRLGFHNYGNSIDGGSFVEVNQQFDNFDSVLNYLPSAMYYGFLSPLPSILNNEIKTQNIGVILAGIETFIFYLIFFGFLYIVFKTPFQLKPLILIILLSITIIILLGYVVPNLGALYRMRQPYFIPVYLAGVQGLYLMLSNYNRKLK